jgi:hypothetical protein
MDRSLYNKLTGTFFKVTHLGSQLRFACAMFHRVSFNPSVRQTCRANKKRTSMRSAFLYL